MQATMSAHTCVIPWLDTEDLLQLHLSCGALLRGLGWLQHRWGWQTQDQDEQQPQAARTTQSTRAEAMAHVGFVDLCQLSPSAAALRSTVDDEQRWAAQILGLPRTQLGCLVRRGSTPSLRRQRPCLCTAIHSILARRALAALASIASCRGVSGSSTGWVMRVTGMSGRLDHNKERLHTFPADASECESTGNSMTCLPAALLKRAGFGSPCAQDGRAVAALGIRHPSSLTVAQWERDGLPGSSRNKNIVWETLRQAPSPMRVSQQ